MSVLILCEAGWRDIRELSLELARRNIENFVLIKGDPGREVKNFITPHESIHNYFIPRWMYRVRLPSFLMFFAWAKKVNVCVWSNPRSKGLLAPYARFCKVKLVRLVEEGNKMPLPEMRENVRNLCDLIQVEQQ